MDISAAEMASASSSSSSSSSLSSFDTDDVDLALTNQEMNYGEGEISSNLKLNMEILRGRSSRNMSIYPIHYPLIIAIEGNIGSGKTTFVEAMRKHLKDYLNPVDIEGRNKIIFYEEPIDEWNKIEDESGETILAKFYANKKKYGFAFQIMALMSRLEIFHNLIRTNPDAIIICERSMLTHRKIFFQMLADERIIDSVCFQIYKRWFDHLIDEINVAGFIYIRAEPEVSHKRVKKRARHGEEISLRYLQNCHMYHDMWLNELPPTRILTLNGNKELELKSMDEETDTMISKYDAYKPWIEMAAEFIRDVEYNERRGGADTPIICPPDTPRLE